MVLPPPNPSIPPLLLRQLLLLDTPKVVLGARCDIIVKREIDWKEGPSSSSSCPNPSKCSLKGKNARCPSHSSIGRFTCSLCTVVEGVEALWIFTSQEDPRREHHLRSLLRLGTTRSELIFCPVCRLLVTRLFNLKEEVGDIESRIRTVLKLRQQQQNYPAKRNSFAAGLRDFMSLDFPKVLLGQRISPIIIKQEGAGNPSHSTPQVIRVVKEERNHFYSSSESRCCSLCTHATHQLTKVTFIDPRRAGQFRSILLLGNREDGVEDMVFCSDVCQVAVTKYFQLQEEVEDMESRIRTVVKFRGEQKLGKIMGSCGRGEKPNPQRRRRRAKARWCPRKECRPCHRIFKTRDECTSHMTKVHQLDFHTHPPILSFQVAGTGHRLFKCPQCGKTYSKKDGVLHHLASIHLLHVSVKKICPICQRGFLTEHIFKAHSHPDKRDPRKVVYTCPDCGKGFKKSNGLTIHQNQVHRRIHRGACPSCGKVFLKKQSLLYHKSICPSSNQEEERKCRQCGQSFANGPQRLDHERVVHMGLPSTKCYFCSKVLSCEDSHCTHLRVHTLERPYLCVSCGKDFAASGHLKDHVIALCGKDERKRREWLERAKEANRKRVARLPYPCKHCNKRFPNEEGLHTHKRREHSNMSLETKNKG